MKVRYVGGTCEGKHEDKKDRDGQGDYDPSKTKDVKDAGGGRHGDDDKGDK